MPFKDSEKSKEYKKEWAKKNKQKIKDNQSEWYLKNKERILDERKKYYEKNKEDIKEYYGNWQDENHNLVMKHSWKQQGIKLKDDEDWDSVYIHWFIQDYCEDCKCKLIFGKNGKNCKVLDHNHETGLIRGVVCQGCNVRRG
tara:strand:+ start:84 stop:509 length:426 start_codon:yes stop_codon:yes gene_type:complete